MEKKGWSTRDICMIGLCAAVIAVMAQISIPMPGGVPMTMQTFAITLVGIVLGSKKGGMSALIYILLGAIGVPVFAGFTGGIKCVIGPTGGFILSFPIMAYIIGLGVEKMYKGEREGVAALAFFSGALIIGTVLNYVVGVIMFCAITGKGVGVGIAACVLPFIPTAIIKAVLASVFGLALRKQLVKIVCA